MQDHCFDGNTLNIQAFRVNSLLAILTYNSPSSFWELWIKANFPIIIPRKLIFITTTCKFTSSRHTMSGQK
jgi:hypothetical protein